MEARHDFSLFGFGNGGIPKAYHLLLDEPDGDVKLARAIIDECRRNMNPGSGPRLQSAEVRAASHMLMEWCGYRGLPPKPIALEASAYSQCLMSPDTGQPLPPKEVRQDLGLPTGVKLLAFMEGVGRDALAIAFAVASSNLDFTEATTLADTGRWSMAAKEMAGILKIDLSVLRDYRARPDYRQLVGQFAFWIGLGWSVTGKAKRLSSLEDVEIRKRVTRVPRAFILAKVGAVADAHPPITLTPAISTFQRNMTPLVEAMTHYFVSAAERAKLKEIR